MRKLKKKDLVKGDEIAQVGSKGIQMKVGKILCIVLHEGKGSTWYWLPDTEEQFSINENTYFKHDTGTYLKDRARFMVYLEGISLPIHHGYIKYETKKKKIKDRNTGKTKEVLIKKIRGLKFDSRIIDILLNRNLADEFTKQHMDLPNLAIIILEVIILIGVLVAAAGHFI